MDCIFLAACQALFADPPLCCKRRLWDDPSLPVISINATAIVVFTQLTIGAEAQQFSQRVTVTLFANGTSEHYITSPLPATTSSPVSIGEKVFAAVRR
jgi:hypothetical protein